MFFIFLQSAQWVGSYGGDFVILRCEMHEILNFEYSMSSVINKTQNSNPVKWVTNSLGLGWWKKLYWPFKMLDWESQIVLLKKKPIYQSKF